MQLSISKRRIIARTALILGMFGPGIFLSLDPNHFTTTKVLATSLNFSPSLVVFIGILLVLASIGAWWEKVRDASFVIGGIFYLMIMLAYMIALFAGQQVGALILALPVLVWVYFEATLTSSQEREGISRPEWRKERG